MADKSEITYKVNLNNLKKQDQAVIDIVDKAYVILYDYTSDGWSKSVEGTLFLVQRAAPPYFAFIILNRLGRDNYASYFEDAEYKAHFEVKFVTYRDQKGTVGMWFHSSDELLNIKRWFDVYIKSTSTATEDEELKELEKQLKDLLLNGAVPSEEETKRKVEANLLSMLRGNSVEQKEEQQPQKLQETAAVDLAFLSLTQTPLIPLSIATETQSLPRVRPAFAEVPTQLMRKSVSKMPKEQFIDRYINQLKNDQEFQERLYQAYLNRN